VSYTEAINRVLATSPCVLKSRGCISRLENTSTNFNPHSYPLTHPNETYLPFYLLEWDSSLLSYTEFTDTVLLPLHAALSALVSPPNESDADRGKETPAPLSQLLSFSLSALECFFHCHQLLSSSSAAAPVISPIDFELSLLDNGILPQMISYWGTNPLVETELFFDLFKHLNRTESLHKAIELNSSEGMKRLFARSAYADRPAPRRRFSSSPLSSSPPLASDKCVDGEVVDLRSALGALESERNSLLVDVQRLQSESTAQVEDNRTLMKQLEQVVFELSQREGAGDRDETIQTLEKEMRIKEEEMTAQAIIIQAHLESILRLQNELKEIKAKSLVQEDENATLRRRCSELEVEQRKEVRHPRTHLPSLFDLLTV
jgi:hypothetical protein